MSIITAEDIMTRQVVTLTPDTPIHTAMEVLLKHRISGAPVVSDGLLVGVISEYDCMKVISAGLTDLYSAPTGNVSEYMSSAPITCTPTATIGDIAGRFLTQRVRRLPVVDERNRLVGLVSRRDVLKGLIEHQDSRTPAPVSYPDYRRPS